MSQSKKSKTTPLGKKILLDIPESKMGNVVVQQGAQIQEQGTVLAVGSEVENVKVGDVIHFKAWGVDVITIDGVKFYYLDCSISALCGVVK